MATPTDEELGLEPLVLPDYEPEQDFAPTRGQSILESLYGSLEGAQAPRPQNFGEGLVMGLLQNLGQRGGKVATARQKFERRQIARRLQTDDDRRKATADYNKRRADALVDVAGETRAATRKAGEVAAEQITVTPELAKRYPALASFEGQTLPERTLKQYTSETPAERRANRPPPAEQPLVAIVGPDGKPVLVSRAEARGKTPFSPTAPGAKMPSATERSALAADTNAVGQTQNIKSLYRPEFVGPFSGRRGAAGMTTGKGLKTGEAKFRAGLAIFRNAVINALSGAAVSESEAARMRQQIPNENDPSEAFEAKLAETESNLQRVAQLRRQTFTDTGLDLSGLAPLPGTSASRTGGAPLTDEQARAEYDALRKKKR